MTPGKERGCQPVTTGSPKGNPLHDQSHGARVLSSWPRVEGVIAPRGCPAGWVAVRVGCVVTTMPTELAVIAATSPIPAGFCAWLKGGSR